MRIAAFTLFESTVAVTIIAVVIGLATLIYGNLINSERPVAYYQAEQEVGRLFNETKESGAFFSKNFTFDSYEIQQNVDFHKGNKKLYQLDYVVTSFGKPWFTESHLVPNLQTDAK